MSKDASFGLDAAVASIVEETVGQVLSRERLVSTLDSWVSNEEAMRLLGVSRTSLQRYRSSGRLPYVIIGGRVRYRRADVESLLQTSPHPNGH